jgi:hypothetical protein
MSRIPASYRPASFRSATPLDREADEMGLSFETNDGQVIRLKLCSHSAESLQTVVRDFLVGGEFKLDLQGGEKP